MEQRPLYVHRAALHQTLGIGNHCKDLRIAYCMGVPWDRVFCTVEGKQPQRDLGHLNDTIKCFQRNPTLINVDTYLVWTKVTAFESSVTMHQAAPFMDV